MHVLPTVTVALALGLAGAACARPEPPAASGPAAHAGPDALNARLSAADQRRDTAAYAALYTDTATFEWPAVSPVRGRRALAAMAAANWAAQRDVTLRLRVAARRVAGDHATEFGAFEQSWRDSVGVRRTEFGRYASLLARGADRRWYLDRFLGFEESTLVTRAEP